MPQGPRSRMIEPIACRRGWVCDEPGLIGPKGGPWSGDVGMGMTNLERENSKRSD